MGTRAISEGYSSGEAATYLTDKTMKNRRLFEQRSNDVSHTPKSPIRFPRSDKPFYCFLQHSEEFRV